MPAKHDTLTREGVEFRYVIKDQSPEAIHDATGIAASTVRRWAKLYRWDEAKLLRRTSGRSIAARLRANIDSIIAASEEAQRVLTPAEWDGIYKGWKVIEAMDKNAAFASNALEVLDELNTYLAEHAPHLSEQVAEHLAAFARELVSRASL